MPAIPQFNEVLSAADGLSLEDQEALVDILRRRLIERRREVLRAEIEEAEEEFRRGLGKAVTVKELMDEITS
ncbi:MAG: hypothetical protein L0Y70_07075 [Gemmataceae bacterium]|nr:hypothetical protein [Gemmataceae bacterium]